MTQFAAVAGTNNYTAEVTPFIDGIVTLQVPAVIADGFVFMSTYTQAQHSLIFDQTPPGVTVVCDVASPTNADPIPFTVTFDESVTGFDTGGVQVVNGTISQLQENLPGREYALQITPTAPGAVTVTVLENAVTDTAGNTNAAAAGTVTAVASNHAPVAQDDAFSVPEDGSWSDTLTATDPDQGDTLTYRIVTAPAHGALTSFTAATGSFVYEPTPNFSGPDAFTFDATDGTADSNTGTVTITVTPVNDAPVLTPANPVLLPGITEDEVDNSGAAIGTLLTGSVTDADNGALQGVAVFNCTGSAGTWQYRLDAAPNWLDLSAPDPTQAMLLRSEDRIRFRPDGTLGTVAGLEFCAWDQSSGAAADTTDVSVRGGSTPFSTATDTVTLLVADVNDRPELGGAAISPNPAYLGDTLTAVPGACTDADGDAPSYYWQWAVDGTDVPGATSATLNGSHLRQGDSVTCLVTPWDGTETGTPVHTPAVVIGWISSVQVRDGGGTAVQFGMEPGAGPGFDPGIDAEATPGGRFDGDLYLVQGAEYYTRDMRSLSDTADWLLTVVTGSTDAVLEWDPATVPPDQHLSLLSAAANGAPDGDLSIDMGLESELAVAAGETRHFLIRYAADVSVALAFSTGYNLVSLPVEPLDPDVDSVLATGTGRDGAPVHTGPVWIWNETHYIVTTVLHAQEGVWVYVETPCVVIVHGLPVDPTLNLMTGWNLVGPATRTPVPQDSRVYHTFWAWDTDAGQRVATNPGDILQPGRGYWVLAYGPCQITPSR